MSRNWAAHHLLVLFLTITLLPALGLGWMGWRLVEQDRAFETRRIQEQRDRATDLVTTALQQSIAADEQRLSNSSDWRSLASDDAHIVVFSKGVIETIPETRLLYSPIVPILPEPTAELFQSGEEDEFQLGNYASAALKFQSLAHSANPIVRAGAQLRLGRNLRHARQLSAALDVYRDLAQQDAMSLDGVPAGLVAQRALCALLAEMQRAADLKSESERLRTDLQRGRWQIDHAQFTYYSNEVDKWLDHASPADPAAITMADAVERLWTRWKALQVQPAAVSGHDVLQSGDRFVTLLFHATPDRMVALVAGPAYLQRRWLGASQPLLASQGLHLLFQDPSEHSNDRRETIRDANVTGLPWTLRVAAADPQAELAQAVARRRLLLAGLTLLVIVVCAGSYFVSRAVTRELALARLQSDFVAAVSHEFRTPLTSLGQVTEILSDGRVADPNKLQRYYETQARATNRLQRLVESLLDFGRMEAGTKPYRMQKLDSPELVRSAIEDLRAGSGAAGYQFEVHVEADATGGYAVNADPEALANALRNLLDNAVKYSPDCRTIWVAIRKAGSRVAISVRDRGFGIPRAEQKEIFRKFVRGEATKTNGIKGAGVGLAVVQHIVRAHGGEIRLQSEPGQGSTFTMLLPAVDH
jgi:signal transduction histidine kinase